MLGGFTDARPEIIRRDDRPGLALDGFHQNSGNADPKHLADLQLSFHRIRISKRDVVDRSAVKNTDRFTVIGLADHAQASPSSCHERPSARQ